MGKIVQKQTKILQDNVKRNMIGAITLSALTLAIPFILFLLPDPTVLQFGGLAALVSIGLFLAVFLWREYAQDRRLYLAVSGAPCANEERTIHCHKIKFRGYATNTSPNRHASAIWAIILIDENNSKYTYVLEEAKSGSSRHYDAIKQKLTDKELAVLCYQDTNVIKKIRDVKL